MHQSLSYILTASLVPLKMLTNLNVQMCYREELVYYTKNFKLTSYLGITQNRKYYV